MKTNEVSTLLGWDKPDSYYDQYAESCVNQPTQYEMENPEEYGRQNPYAPFKEWMK